MGQSSIPCIGHLSAGEIVKASGLSYDEFAGKKVLDIGCGFSGFLGHLGANTQAERLVGIDPIFQDDQTLEFGMGQTKAYIFKILQTPDISDYAREQLSGRLEEIYTFGLSRAQVEYHADIFGAGGEKFDYIFVSFVFRHLPRRLKIQLAQQMIFLQTKGGVITVLDGLPELKNLKKIIGSSNSKAKDPEHYEKSVSVMKIN